MVQTVKNILFIGGTGWLGSQVILSLLDKKVFHVKVLVRADTLTTKKDAIDAIRAKGAEIVQGDVNNVEELTNAAKGSDTIISIISGGTLLSGQESNIVKAAVAAGVKRIVPSQFGIDISAIPNPIPLLDIKVKLLNEIKAAGLEYTVIVTSMWYEFWFSPAAGFDTKNKTVSVLGDGNQKFTSNKIADIAKFIPEILLDPYSKNQTIRLEGQTLTQNQTIAIWEQVSGQKVQVIHKSLEDLKAEKPPAELAFVPILSQVIWQHPDSVNFSGRSDNWRYPSVVTTSVKEYFQSLNQ